MSYLPLFASGGNGGAAGTQRAAAEDHLDLAFDDSDSDDDEPSSRRERQSRAPSPPSTRINLPLGYDDPLSVAGGGSGRQGGSIRLPDDDDDETDRYPGATSSSSRGARIPGGYDFEPQGSEGAPARTGFGAPSSARTGGGAAAGSRHSASQSVSLRDRLLGSSLYSRFAGAAGLPPARQQAGREEDSRLLFAANDEDDSAASGTDTEGRGAYPPQQASGSHLPLPARPPSFAPPPVAPGAAPGARTYGGGQGNDGVFANLTAKPEGVRRQNGEMEYVGGEDAYGGDKDEIPPSYEAAANDQTPPYWETTILTPGGVLGPDDVLVDGLPVGNFFAFAWNLLVSMSFQFIGFLLTYLLHSTHAAKNGSRAGLGITLIQFGFYLKQRADHPELIKEEMMAEAAALNGAGPDGSGADAGWSWWGGASSISETATATATGALGALPTQLAGSLSGAMDASDPDAVAKATSTLDAALPRLSGMLNPDDVVRMSQTANEWMGFMMMSLGWFVLLAGCLSYWRAVRFAKAVSRNVESEREGVTVAEA